MRLLYESSYGGERKFEPSLSEMLSIPKAFHNNRQISEQFGKNDIYASSPGSLGYRQSLSLSSGSRSNSGASMSGIRSTMNREDVQHALDQGGDADGTEYGSYDHPESHGQEQHGNRGVSSLTMMQDLSITGFARRAVERINNSIAAHFCSSTACTTSDTTSSASDDNTNTKGRPNSSGLGPVAETQLEDDESDGNNHTSTATDTAGGSPSQPSSAAATNGGTSTPASLEFKAVTIYDYSPKVSDPEDCVSIRKNSLVLVIEKLDRRWWRIRGEGGIEGLVPAFILRSSSTHM